MGVSPLGGNNLYLLNIPQIREGGKSEHLLLENLYLIIEQMENIFFMLKDLQRCLKLHWNHIFLHKTASRFGLLRISCWYYSFIESFYINQVYFISSNICHFSFSLIFVPNFSHLNPILKKEFLMEQEIPRDYFKYLVWVTYETHCSRLVGHLHENHAYVWKPNSNTCLIKNIKSDFVRTTKGHISFLD